MAGWIHRSRSRSRVAHHSAHVARTHTHVRSNTQTYRTLPDPSISSTPNKASHFAPHAVMSEHSIDTVMPLQEILDGG